MKFLTPLFFLSIVLGFYSCGPNLPTAEQMKKEQQEYEVRKAAALKDKGAFYKANKNTLVAKANEIEELLLKEVNYDNIPSDTLYRHGVSVNFVELDRKTLAHGDTTMGSKAALTVNTFTEDPANFPETVASILACDSLGTDKACYELSDEALYNFSLVSYVFVDEDMLTIEPTLQGNSEFQGGLTLHRVTCYNLETGEPFYTYTYHGENSDQIQTHSQYDFESPTAKLKNDLRVNTLRAKSEALSLHFTVL